MSPLFSLLFAPQPLTYQQFLDRSSPVLPRMLDAMSSENKRVGPYSYCPHRSHPHSVHIFELQCISWCRFSVVAVATPLFPLALRHSGFQGPEQPFPVLFLLEVALENRHPEEGNSSPLVAVPIHHSLESARLDSIQSFENISMVRSNLKWRPSNENCKPISNNRGPRPTAFCGAYHYLCRNLGRSSQALSVKWPQLRKNIRLHLPPWHCMHTLPALPHSTMCASSSIEGWRLAIASASWQ